MSEIFSFSVLWLDNRSLIDTQAHIGNKKHDLDKNVGKVNDKPQDSESAGYQEAYWALP